MQFVGVDGQEHKDMDSPSFYNIDEAMEVANTVSYDVVSQLQLMLLLSNSVTEC